MSPEHIWRPHHPARSGCAVTRVPACLHSGVSAAGSPQNHPPIASDSSSASASATTQRLLLPNTTKASSLTSCIKPCIQLVSSADLNISAEVVPNAEESVAKSGQPYDAV
jgi:hypothetical protein